MTGSTGADKARGATLTKKGELDATRGPGLTADPPAIFYPRMLQHNASVGRPAHIAHTAMVALHALCCGVPGLALLAAALAGTASGVLLVRESVGRFHAFVHAGEAWILGVSAALVVTGGILEAVSRRGRRQGFPWLFALSAVCFLANVALVAAHRWS